MFLVKCDVHPWMTAYVGVFSQPVLRGHRQGRQVHDRRPAAPAPTRSRPGTRSSASKKATVTVGRRATARRSTSSSRRPPASERPPRVFEETRGADAMAQATVTHHGARGARHDAHHDELGFWRKYVFSTDHKVIGIQYAVTGLLFLFFGFCLMMLMRWQLAFPGSALPLIGTLFGEARMPGGVDAARVLQRARRHARHDHGLPRRRAAGGRRLRQLRPAAADRRARHGVPAHQHGELLVLLPRRRVDARELLRAGRRGAVGLDLLRAARRTSPARARRCGSSAWSS